MTVKYIIGHWTAGALKPNKLDLNSYQLLIDGDGVLHKGLAVGCAASTGGMNSITYNIACCGGLSSSQLTEIQIEKFFKTCAEKLKEYNLTVDKFYTHAEIGEMTRAYHLKMQGKSYDNNYSYITTLLQYNGYLLANIGKIDLTVLPYMSGNAKQTGNFIRNKIKWYYNKAN